MTCSPDSSLIRLPSSSQECSHTSGPLASLRPTCSTETGGLRCSVSVFSLMALASAVGKTRNGEPAGLWPQPGRARGALPRALELHGRPRARELAEVFPVVALLVPEGAANLAAPWGLSPRHHPRAERAVSSGMERRKKPETYSGITHRAQTH